ALTFGNMAYDAMLDGKTGLMAALMGGCYELMPIPDPKLGPRKLNVATTYNIERCRPIYANKQGLPGFLNRAGASWVRAWVGCAKSPREALRSGTASRAILRTRSGRPNVSFWSPINWRFPMRHLTGILLACAALTVPASHAAAQQAPNSFRFQEATIA